MEKNEIAMLLNQGLITDLVQQWLNEQFSRIPIKVMETAFKEDSFLVTVVIGEEKAKPIEVNSANDLEYLKQIASTYHADRQRQVREQEIARRQFNPDTPNFPFSEKAQYQEQPNIMDMLEMLQANNQGLEE